MEKYLQLLWHSTDASAKVERKVNALLCEEGISVPIQSFKEETYQTSSKHSAYCKVFA
jgi:hypothetical protein